MTAYIKDPQAVLDYAFNWTAWLAAGETITSHTITADPGITVNSHTESGGTVTAWLAGGAVGTVYCITCEIVTSGGRTDDRSIEVSVEQR